MTVSSDPALAVVPKCIGIGNTRSPEFPLASVDPDENAGSIGRGDDADRTVRDRVARMGSLKGHLETGRGMLRSINGTEPQVADSAYVDPAAVVIGDVVIEDDASVWPNTTLRGDHGRIVVGEGANVQDNAVLHEEAELEPYSTVGHSAIVHDATVAERALVGMNAVVLDGAHVGEEAVVAAGSVVTEDTAVPPSTLVTGAPAEPKAEIDDPDLKATADRYVELSKEYAETSERLD